MGERGDGLGFSFEPITEVRVIGKTRRQNLDRDRAIEAGIARRVDFTHAPGTEGGEDFVRTEARAGSEGQV